MCPSLSGESGRRIHFGINFGTFPLVSPFNLYRLGGEVGCHFSEYIGVVVEFAYGYTNSSYGPWGHRRLSGVMKYSYSPINASLILTVPIGKKFSIYSGLGLGLYSIKITDEWTDSPPGYESSSGTRTNEIKGLAYHFNFGIEFAVFNRITVFSEVKEISETSKLKEIEYYGYSNEGDVHFGRPEVKIGIRFYFKD